MSTETPIIVLTGFGPFRNYIKNASWEVVKEVSIPDAVVVKIEVPVAYESVNELTTRIWRDYKPKLVVHLGVSYLAEGLVLESLANPQGYCKKDVNGCLPLGGDGPSDDPCPCLRTALNLQRVAESMSHAISENRIQVPVSVSQDAGRYLCEYIYAKSLAVNSTNCVFIHVPELHKWSAIQCAQTLALVLQELLTQVGHGCSC